MDIGLVTSICNQLLSSSGFLSSSSPQASALGVGTPAGAAGTITATGIVSCPGVLITLANTTTYFGYNALYGNTVGNNTAFGAYALGASNGGASNSAFAFNALANNSTGADNVAVGVDSLYSNLSGSFNTGVGNLSGYSPAGNAANGNSTGTLNTYVGYQSGADSATQRTNTTVLGANALSTADNQVSLGDSSVTNIRCGAGNASVTCASVKVGACTLYSGAGTPEAAVTAVVGSLFMRSDGGAGTSLYVKQSGSGNTGWVAK